MNMMKRLLIEDQRLVLLRSLIDCGGSANESVLQTCLQSYGHRVSRDTVKTQLYWLDEQNLVSIQNVAGCLVGQILGRGEDVAQGLAVVSGVKKPRIDDYE